MHRSFTLLALAALCVTSVKVLRKKHQERLAATPRAQPAEVQTWEGEGGGLPQGGPGLTVTPAAAPMAETAPWQPAGARSSLS
jgi:hypothetical protein